MSRPIVGVYKGKDEKKNRLPGVKLPAVFTVPVRDDVIRDVHTRMSKNHRQPYAVSKTAGEQTSAESWGTGRAVARIPRVSGGGTHRSGQGAFGNMCRKGRMFAPNKVWRRWHRRINVEQRRFALVSALAGSAIPALVMARGHKIERVPEVPLVVDNAAVENITKTKNAVAFLKDINAYDDCLRVYNNKSVRAGQGKARNRRWRRRLGPLVVFNNRSTLVQSFRNIPGVDFCNVNRLNLLKLAPGGHVGRFIIWTRDAFEQLDKIYGTFRPGTSSKKHYVLPRPQLTNADIFRIINSAEVQGGLRAKRRNTRKLFRHNALKNIGMAQKLNPYAKTQRRIAILNGQQALKKRAATLQAVKEGKPASAEFKAARKAARARSQKFTKLTAAYHKNLA